jgi:hypothetical protein
VERLTAAMGQETIQHVRLSDDIDGEPLAQNTPDLYRT